MAWGVACLKDLPELERFLVKTEWKTVAFSSRVRNDHLLFEKQGYIILVNYGNSSIEEAVMFTPGGTVLPLLKYGTDIASPGSRQAIDTVLRFCPPVYSIMGVERDVLAIENLLGNNRKRSVDYYLMVLRKEDWKSNHASAPESMIIRKASLRDLKQLFVLQEQYEIEEVCLHPSRFSRKGCLENLKKNMVQEIIFVAEMECTLVAKAATNARGYNTDQIGGIFTIAGRRSQGIGYAITGELLKYIFSTKQMAVLFVKTANAAAIKLYRNLGFHEAENFRITYFNV